MNSELVSLQQDLMKEIANIPLFSSIEALFETRAPSASSSNSGGNEINFRGSLLSLLAEFIDCSLLAIGAAAVSEADRGTTVNLVETWMLEERQLLKLHLSWIEIILADGTRHLQYCDASVLMIYPFF